MHLKENSIREAKLLTRPLWCVQRLLVSQPLVQEAFPVGGITCRSALKYTSVLSWGCDTNSVSSKDPEEWPRALRTGWAYLAFWMVLAWLPAQAADKPQTLAREPVVLTSAAQTLSLTPEEAIAGQPVRVRGVVSLYRPDWNLFFVQDSSGGIYLFDNQTRPDLHTGQWVEVEGITTQGNSGPIVVNPQVRLLSPNEFAATTIIPRPVSLEFILAAKADAQWVRLTSTVREASWESRGLRLRFGSTQAGVTALIPQPLRPANLPTLFRSRVSVRGVCTQQTDEKGHLKSITLFAASPEDFQVVAPPALEPLEVPLHSIGDALDHVELTNKEMWIRLRGTVAGVLGETHFYLDDGKRGIEVTTSIPREVRIGDELEVTGFVIPNERSAILEDAVVRKLATDVAIKPLPLSPLQARNREADGRLVTMEARLLEHIQQKECELLTVATLGTTLTAELRTTNQVGPLAALKLDSLLQLTARDCPEKPDGPARAGRMIGNASNGLGTLNASACR